jgi:hypothetical protein
MSACAKKGRTLTESARKVDRLDGEVLPERRQSFTGVTTNRDAGASLIRADYSGTSGEGRLALPISNEQFFWSDFCSKRVVHVLEPDKLSLQVTYSLLKAAHLRDDAGIWPADVAE